MKAHGLNAKPIASVEQHGDWLFLARVEEFVATDDARLKECETTDLITKVQVIGAYARPLVDA